MDFILIRILNSILFLTALIVLVNNNYIGTYYFIFSKPADFYCIYKDKIYMLSFSKQSYKFGWHDSDWSQKFYFFNIHNFTWLVTLFCDSKKNIKHKKAQNYIS